MVPCRDIVIGVDLRGRGCARVVVVMEQSRGEKGGEEERKGDKRRRGEKRRQENKRREQGRVERKANA